MFRAKKNANLLLLINDLFNYQFYEIGYHPPTKGKDMPVQLQLHVLMETFSMFNREICTLQVANVFLIF